MLRMTLIAHESQGSSGSLYAASQLMHICEYQRFREGDRQTFKTPFMQAGGTLSAFMVPLQGHRSWTASPGSTDAVLTGVVGEEQDVPSPPQTPHSSFLALPPHRPKQSTCTRHLPSQFSLVFGNKHVPATRALESKLQPLLSMQPVHELSSPPQTPQRSFL